VLAEPRERGHRAIGGGRVAVGAGEHEHPVVEVWAGHDGGG
jgi:hypothetical protein